MMRQELTLQYSDTEHEYLYWLCQIPSLGAVQILKMWEHFHSFQAIFNIEAIRLLEEKWISKAAAAEFDGRKPRFPSIAQEYHMLPARGIRFITILDHEYPKRLKHIYGKPAGLYVKGRLPDDEIPSAAIIGARNCTSYGEQVARMLGSSLGREGVQIVSGMALGVDGAGHDGALRSGGSTFAILGSGVDMCYPKSHYSMYRQIPARGGVISEFPLRDEAMPYHFPMRNRIISGLSDVVIVVEAREKSGSLITAELALEQGKEVMAVPGMVTEALSCGCNQLIRQGAGIVTSPDDILEYFQIKRDNMLRLHEKNENALAKEEKIVYSCLNLQPKFFDRIVEESGLSVGACMTLLLELELKGYIVQPSSHYYVKKI